VTLASEHPAVLDPARALLREGFRVSEVAVDGDGLADLDALANAIDERTAIVSVMAANNEIGVLQPLPEIAALCRAAGAWFHSDAAQAVGKVPFDVNEARVDLASISAHKLYGPKGVGALYVRARRPRVRLEPILYGGGHEGGLRSGTLAVAPIVGLGVALDVCLANREPEAKRLRELRERLWARLSELGGVRLNGHAEHRLPGNLNVSFEGVDIDKLLLALPDVAVSTGSACSSAKPEPSHVLRALGLSEAEARASLRFGLGRSTTAAEIDAASSRVAEEVRKQRGD
jgi:cysteine desulfurase